MRKDIFIDSQTAILFSKTKDPLLLELREWLLDNELPQPMEGEEIHDNRAYLVASNALRKEYLRSCQHCDNSFSISNIFFLLQQQGRLNFKKNEEIESFKQKYFNDHVWDSLKCKGRETDDPSHIVLVILSDRRMAIINDYNFINDLLGFKKYGRTCKAITQLTNDFDYKTYAPQHKKAKVH